MPSLIGNRPWQVPSNGDLGRLAFMDNLDSFTSKTVMDTDITNIAPSLNLDFANSKVLDPRITFTRASTATFYNGISSAIAEQNLILNSQNWAVSPWSTIGGGTPTATANADVAPDGTTTATSLVFSAQFQNRSQVQTPIVAGTVYTVSFYAKTISGNTALSIVYEASGSANTPITTTSSWARYSFTFTAAATSAFGTLGIQDRNASGFGTTLVWGAQFEQRSAVTAYTPTTTAAVTNYIPTLSIAANGVARFDHNPITGESLGLLIEEQRVNLVLYSNAFDNAYWTKSNVTITTAANIAPDGTQTAQMVVENTASSVVHEVYRAITGTGNIFSFYAKAAGRNWVAVPASGAYTYFDIANGVLGTVAAGRTATITAVGNGWFRCSLTVPDSTYGADIVLASANGTATYTGNGFAGVYIWGAQIEAGSFATSYIPTVASQVTRSPDAASMTGTNFSSWYNPAEGTVYVEAAPLTSTSSYNAIYAISNNTNANRIMSYMGPDNHFVVQVNSVDQANLDGGATTSNVFAKFGCSYKTNDFGFALNGGAAVTDTSGTIPIVDRLFLGADGSGATANARYIKKISYYPRRLPNSELVEMTNAN